MSSLFKKSPVKQLFLNKDWFRRYMKSLISIKDDYIKSVILFHGFIVEEYIGNEFVVFNSKRFDSFIKKLHDIILESEIKEINAVIKSRLKYIDDEIWKE